MRYVGILLMAGAATGGGFYGAKRLSEQLEILLVLRQMVYHLKSRILHANDTLPEVLMEIGNRFFSQQRGAWEERTQLLYLERTDDSMAALRLVLETKTKLYRYLGVAAGLFLAVVLL